MEPQGLFSWSLPCGRYFGIDVRIHWTLFAMALFQAIDTRAPAWLLPVLLLVPVLSVLAHEFGHALTAKAVGGQADRIILWMFGGLAMCVVPPVPLQRFLVAAAGPVVSLILAVVCILILDDGLWPGAGAAAAWGLAGYVLLVGAWVNVILLAFNLIPAYPLDGGAMLRAILWPIVGLPRARIITIWVAYICLGGLMLWAVTDNNVWLAVLAVLLFLTVAQEHRALNLGHDPYDGLAQPGYSASHAHRPAPAQAPSWWDRRQARSAARVAERDAERQAADEAELDRLLAKVKTEGLPSLSATERTFLQRYSEAQRP